MTDVAPKARVFLDAFASIEDVLAREQGRRASNQKRRGHDEDWIPFGELLADSKLLHDAHKRELRAYAKLRNAIVHNSYRNGAPIADPHDETVESIVKILALLEKPPLLSDALRDSPRPRVFKPDDDISEFLGQVTEHSYSQAPVSTVNGYLLITTNAVARWFASNLAKHGGVVDRASIQDVLGYAELGDRLETVSPTTTVISAIHRLSGEADMDSEPPTALLVLGKMNQPPQQLCSRADLAKLYAPLQISHY